MWEPPRELEEYRIVQPIGAGAMGQVFLGHDRLLDRPVAIKFVGALEVGAAARERFFTEARAVARLSHPNVVAVYRVGEFARRPYLVSEYVRGDALAQLPKPLPWERALRIAIGLARGLGAAHRRGVLHRDIKPANAIVGEDGEAKLLDFGVAKLLAQLPSAPAAAPRPVVLPEGDIAATVSIAQAPATAAANVVEDGGALTVDGAIVGTPLYLAPELWRGEAATPRSDVYALGVVLYELIAGRAPHAGLAVAELADRARDRDAAPIASIAADLPGRLAELVDACVSRDPARRPASGDALCELLEGVVDRDLPSIAGSPYRGLATFEPEHRAVFFGRTDEARAVVERLRTETLVVVAGDSGAGKSSLCRAAVLPAVAEKSLAGKRWRTVTMLPGARPLARLTAALETRATDEGLLLFVDQLEELLTVAEPDDAAAVAERLAELAVSTSSVRILASARSDFLGRLAALPGLGDLLGRALYLLGPLGDRALRDAIVGPAQALGYELEPALVEELVASGRRNLPLLQFTLAELWEARDDATRTLPADALARMGGVGGALGRRADQVMAALGDADRELAWRVFVRLTTAEGTRNVLSRRELAEAIDADIDGVLERLVAARLLAIADGGARVEVVHEALFTGWPRLVAWRRAHEDGARMRDLHAEAARAWDRQGRPRGLLWRGDALADYRAWRRRWPDQPTGIEAAFAAASEADARRTRRIRAALLGAVVVALAAGVAVLYRADRRAVAERDEAERQRRTLLVEHGAQELAAGHPSRALPYLVEALREGEDTPAMRVLLAEATRPYDRLAFANHDMAGGLTGIAWSPDGKRFAATAMDGEVRLFDAEGKTLKRARVAVDRHAKWTGSSVAFAPDGRRIAFFTTSDDTHVWDLETGALTAIPHAQPPLAFDPAGRLYAATDNVLDVWDRDGRRVARHEGVTCFGLTPDGAVVAVRPDGDVVRLDGGTAGARVAPPTKGCRIAARDPSRIVVLVGTELTVLDPVTLARLNQLADVTSFDVAGGTLATTTDEAAHVADVVTGVSRGAIRVPAVGNLVQLDPRGDRLVLGDAEQGQRVWNVRDRRVELAYATTSSPTAPHSTAMTIAAAFSPDGELLLVATGSELTMLRMSRAPLVDELVTRSAYSARLSPDERALAVGGGNAVLEAWDLARRERTTFAVMPELFVWPGFDPAHDLMLWTIAWNPAGDALLAVGRLGRVEILTPRGERVRAFTGQDPEKIVNAGAWSPDGTRVAAASDDGTLRVWNAATGEPVATLRHPDRAMALAWSRDGTHIATACWDGTLRVWSLATGTADELHDDVLRFLDAALSPDETRLAATTHSGIAGVWDLATHRRVLALDGHAGSSTSVAWSPDGALLATTGIDASVRVWDAATGRQLVRADAGGEGLQVSWTRDGTRVVTASSSGLVRFWEVSRDMRTLPELEAILRKLPYELVDGRLELVR